MKAGGLRIANSGWKNPRDGRAERKTPDRALGEPASAVADSYGGRTSATTRCAEALSKGGRRARWPRSRRISELSVEFDVAELSLVHEAFVREKLSQRFVFIGTTRAMVGAYELNCGGLITQSHDRASQVRVESIGDAQPAQRPAAVIFAEQISRIVESPGGCGGTLANGGLFASAKVSIVRTDTCTVGGKTDPHIL